MTVIPTHTSMCFDGEGSLDCVCRWAQESQVRDPRSENLLWPRPGGWDRRSKIIWYRCVNGHSRPYHFRDDDRLCMVCLEPLTEVTDA